MNGYQRDGSFNLPMTFETRQCTNTEEFYRLLAEALTEKSTKERWKPEDKIKVTVNNKEYEVGPFISNESEDYIIDDCLSFGFPDDDYIVVSHEGGFDSWGEWETPFRQRIDFNIAKVVAIKKIYKNIW